VRRSLLSDWAKPEGHDRCPPKSPESRTAAMDEIRAALASTAKNAQIEMGTLEASIQRSLRRDRLVAQLSAILGIVGMILAAIGLYGVMSHEVARRVREIGIRIAVGAQTRHIVRTAIGEAALVTPRLSFSEMKTWTNKPAKRRAWSLFIDPPKCWQS
jgi:hypothetical protein